MVGVSAAGGAPPNLNDLKLPYPWYKNSRLIKLNLWILLLLITSSTNGYDGSIMNGLQGLDTWQNEFGHPTGSKLGALGCIQQVGSLAATPFAPYLTDIFGRRAPVLFGALIMLAGTAAQASAHTFGAFLGGRFCIGFGLTFAAMAAPLLVTEIAHPTQRAPLTSTYNSLWYSGNVVAAWTTYGTFRMTNNWAWRIPAILQGLPSAIQLCLMWWCPESPRWLLNKGREAEALRILAYYHADGNEADPIVQFEYNEMKEAIQLDREIADRVGWVDLFKTPGNRRRVRIIVALAFFSQWSGNGIVSYYLPTVLNQIGITSQAIITLINALLSIWNLIIAVGAGLYCDRIGRRPAFLISGAGMLVFFIVQTICSARYAITQAPAAAHAVIAGIFLYYAFYDIAYSPLIVSYTVEILPFQLRAKGFTLFNFMVSLSLIFNQYANPVALKAIQWKYYIVYCVWLAFEFGFMYLFLIETKGRSLEETAVLFDGEDKIQELAAHAVADTNVAIGGGKAASLDEKASDEVIEHK